MDIYLNLVGLKVKVSDYPHDTIPKAFTNFITPGFDEEKADIVYRISYVEEEPEIKGECILQAQRHSIFYDEGTYIKVSELGEIKYYTIFNDMNIQLLIPVRYKKEYHMAIMSSLMFDYVITNFNRILMHASVIRYNSDGILFTGPSGMGKSTQANLWVKYKAADVLNGDRAVLYQEGNKVTVYGSPYAGSSGIFKNESATVKAIVLLRQEKTNTIERLSVEDAFKLLFPRFSLSRWNNEVFGKCMSIVSTILEKVPVYLLSCYPGEESVDLLYNTIYEHKKVT